MAACRNPLETGTQRSPGRPEAVLLSGNLILPQPHRHCGATLTHISEDAQHYNALRTCASW